MTTDTFRHLEDSVEDWIDVRISDPERGEWDVDIVVIDGRVESVDLRIRPALLDSFIECLVDVVDEERAEATLSRVTDRQTLDLDGETTNTDG